MIPQLYLNVNSDVIDSCIQSLISHTGTHLHNKYLVEPSPNSIGIEQIRTLREEMLLRGARGWIIIFYSFEKTTIEAQNALLKLFEDWGEIHQFVLFANRKEDILSTIISRCQVIRSKDGINNTSDELLALFSNTDFNNKLLLLSHPLLQATTAQQAQEIIHSVISFYRIKIRAGNYAYLSKVNKAMEVLEKSFKNNLNPQLSVDLVVLDMIQSG